MSGANSIGIKKERSLHAELKRRYAGENGKVEEPIGSFVCDAVRDDGEIVEIQSGNFGAIKDKIAFLVRSATVRLVFPIALVRWIEVYSTDGALIRRRKSPRRGTEWELFGALIRAPLLPLLHGLSIELALVEETEVRVDDGRGSWRRKGVSVTDRKMETLRGRIVLNSVSDYRALLPPSLDSLFTVKDLAKAAGIRPVLARKALYVLSRIGIVREQGKQGNAKQYVRS